jgi:hypothetical protein
MMLSKKAEGGFMESIVAVIAVVITLTAFLSFLAVSLSHNDAIERDIMPADLLNDVRIVNGTIETDIEQKMIVASELNGYQGMRVILSVADGTYDSSLTVNVGSFDSDIIRSRSGTFIVKSNDGRSVPVNFVMAVWT